MSLRWVCWRAACKIEFEAVEFGDIRREFPGRKAKAAEINIKHAAVGLLNGPGADLPSDLPFQVGAAWSRPATRS